MSGPSRRAGSLAAALTLGVLVAAPQSAFADLLAPDSPASPQSGATRTAFIVVAVLSTLLALGVIAAVLRAVRSGGRSGDEPARRTRGTTSIQRRVGAGLGVGVLILFVFGVVFTERARDVEASTSGAEPITIGVDGQQWVWRYEYPLVTDTSDGYSADTAFSFHDLYIPVDTPVTLDVSSIDVLHRWWVPSLARAVDAVPGDVNSISFVADELGDYEGRSTEFSGPGYATMTTTVHVVEPEEYDAFLEQQVADLNEARDAVQEAVEAGTAPGVALEEGG